MAEYGFYRGSGAAWQRALPPEVQRIGDEAALHRCWALLVLDREGARRLAGQGPAPLCGTVLLPQDVWPEPLRARQVVSCGPSPQSSLTLSSLAQRCVLCVQRQLTALNGTVIEPQDIPLPEALVLLGQRYGVELPICQAVHRVLYCGADPMQELRALLDRNLTREFGE